MPHLQSGKPTFTLQSYTVHLRPYILYATLKQSILSSWHQKLLSVYYLLDKYIEKYNLQLSDETMCNFFVSFIVNNIYLVLLCQTSVYLKIIQIGAFVSMSFSDLGVGGQVVQILVTYNCTGGGVESRTKDKFFFDCLKANTGVKHDEQLESSIKIVMWAIV